MAQGAGTGGVILDAQGIVKRFKRRSAFSFLKRKGEGEGDAGGTVAVAGVNLTLREGEVVGLVGESGSGKTTLGKCLLRLHEVSAGQILIDGLDLSALEGEALRKTRARYQMIFQNPHSSLNPGMRVEDMLRETLQIHLGMTGDEAEARIDQMLETVGLSDKRRARPGQLSGGQKRRVGLARVLLLSPRLIVADEPTAGLDASLKAGVLRLLLETQRPDMAYLIITHDLHLIRSVATRILVMFRGHIVEEVPQGHFELGLVHHPYTELLLSSFFLGGGRKVPVPPPPPTPVENFSLPEIEGCCYYPYCARARSMGEKSEQCRRLAPPLSGRRVTGRAENTPLASGPPEGAIACHFT